VAASILVLVVLSGSIPAPGMATSSRGPAAPILFVGSTAPAARHSSRAAPAPTVGSSLAWVNLSSGSPATPPCGGDQGLAYDPLLWEFVSFGGVIPCSGPGFAGDSTWTFANGTWKNVSASLSTAPSARYGMAMVYDAAEGYILAFGGATSGGVPFNETWTFNGTWTDITGSQTTSPPAVFNAGAAYDAATGSVLLLDGLGAGDVNTNGTWAFSGGLWSEVPAATLPPALHSPGMLYDPTTSSVLLFGGVNAASQILSQTWSFANGTWTELFPADSPPAVFDLTAFFDGGNRLPILFGGYTALPPVFAPIGGTWTFSNGTWSNISSSITGSPTPRGSARAAYDSAENWTLVFGGRGGSSLSLLDDTWAFPGVPLWSARLSTSQPSVDQGNSVTLTAAPNGGIGPYSFAYAGLPAGCASANTSALACSPRENGTFNVSVNVTDSTGHRGSAGVSLVVNPPLAVSLNSSVGTVILGGNVTFRAAAVGGGGGDVYSYSESQAGCVPNGALLACVPTIAGSLEVTAHVGDRVGGVANSSTVIVAVLEPISVSMAASADEVDLGQGLVFNLTANGGSGGFSILYSGLPTGCTSSNTTRLSCTPTGVGNFSVVAHVQDSLGATALSSAVPVSVAPALFVLISEFAPKMVVGTPFETNATVTGGSPPLSYTWTGLPPGCSGIRAELQCVPTTAGTYSFRLLVSDVAGVSDSANGTATVGAAVPLTTIGPPNLFANPLVWGAIVIALVVVGVGVALVLRRRTPPPAQPAPTPPAPAPPEESGWVVRENPPRS
jgi:hypothetical protein